MHTVNRTFSLPQDVDRDLHLFVKKRGMSQFVAEAIRKELKEKEAQLIEDYKMASKDPEQKKVYKDMESTLNDGLDTTNDW